jgi:hypothetical protein
LLAKLIISFAMSFWFATIWQLVDLPESSGRRIKNFTCLYNSTMVLHAYIPPGGWIIGSLVSAVQRHSLTPLTSSSSSTSLQCSVVYMVSQSRRPQSNTVTSVALIRKASCTMLTWLETWNWRDVAKAIF